MAKYVKVSDSTHENLGIIKDANKTHSYDGAIRQMMQGCTDDLRVIKREQTALTLTYQGYKILDLKSKKTETIHESCKEVTFRQLRKMDVGDIIEPPIHPDEYYEYQIAIVVYADSDFVALKITTYKELPWLWDYTDVELIGVHLF